MLTILVSKYIEEHNENNPNSKEIYFDSEQEIYKILENIISNTNSKIILYYTSHLYYHLITITQKVDIYISIEKYLSKLKNGLEGCKNNLEEYNLFKQKFLENFGLICGKSKIDISLSLKNFVLDLIISQLTEKAEKINENKEQLNFFFQNEKKLKQEDYEIEELGNLKIMISLNLDCFHKYLVQFTNDITTGKKIWKNIEELIKNKIEDQHINQMLIELIIMYIFGMSKSLNYGNKIFYSEDNKCKLIFSTIFEFLCDKLNSSRIKVVAAGEYKSVNLNLFYEIIYNYVDILIDDILNERYMQVK